MHNWTILPVTIIVIFLARAFVDSAVSRVTKHVDERFAKLDAALLEMERETGERFTDLESTLREMQVDFANCDSE